MQTPPDSLIHIVPPKVVLFGGPADLSKMTLRVMSKVQYAGLSFFEKQQISQLLGTSHDGGTHRHWSLRSPDCDDSNLDDQIAWIFSQLTDDLAAWQQLGEHYRLDLFIGLFLEHTNGGAELSPESMKFLFQRNIPIGFDIYTPTSVSETPTAPEIDLDEEVEEIALEAEMETETEGETDRH